MKFKQANTYTVQCMGQGISQKSNKYNGIQPAIKAKIKQSWAGRKNQGRGLICTQAVLQLTSCVIGRQIGKTRKTVKIAHDHDKRNNP